jgi:hypothetical protein
MRFGARSAGDFQRLELPHVRFLLDLLEGGVADGAVVAALDEAAEIGDERQLIEQAIARLGLSAREYDRVLKVARTIADLAGTERLDSAHVGEAVRYRALDRGYFRCES